MALPACGESCVSAAAAHDSPLSRLNYGCALPHRGAIGILPPFLEALTMWRLRDEICNSTYAFLLDCSLDRCRSDRLLPRVGEPCTRDLRETTCMAGAGDWLAVDDCATGTHGFCAAVHLDAHPDVELRQRQGRELYPV